jgi:hypothetical protein
MSDKISLIAEICLIIYSSFVASHMLQPHEKYTKKIIHIFNNKFFRLICFVFISYLMQINMRLALFFLIAWFVTNDNISKYVNSRNMLAIIKNKNKSREIKI